MKDYLIAKDYTINEKLYYGYKEGDTTVGRTADGVYTITVKNQIINTDREHLMRMSKMIRNLLAKGSR